MLEVLALWEKTDQDTGGGFESWVGEGQRRPEVVSERQPEGGKGYRSPEVKACQLGSRAKKASVWGERKEMNEDEVWEVMGALEGVFLGHC